MTRFAPLWGQANTYPAAVDRGLGGALWPSGGASGAVAAKVAGTMNVTIPPGFAAVPVGGQGTMLCRWDAPEVVTLGAAPPSGNNRIDLVVCLVRDAELDGGGNNDFVFSVVAGAPAASNPAVPAVPARALALAQVLVLRGTANLDTATLTDVRLMGLRADAKPAGSLYATVQTVGSATFNVLLGGTDFLRNGMTRGGGPDGLIVPRAGIYLVTGQVTYQNSNNPVPAGSYDMNLVRTPAAGNPAGNDTRWFNSYYSIATFARCSGASLFLALPGDRFVLQGQAPSAQGTYASAALTFLNAALVAEI